MKTIYYAEFKYKRNVFRAVGSNEHTVHQSLFRGVRLWCEANGIKANPVLKLVDERRYDTRIMTTGCCYCNGFEIGMRESLG